MVRGLACAALLAAATGLFANSQATNPVISARFSIVREPRTDLLIHITNLRSVPLEHYAVAVTGNTFFWHRSIMTRENLPIRTGERQTHRIAVDDAQTARPTLVLLGFSDGYFEGERDALQRHFVERGTPLGTSITDKRPTIVDGRSATMTAVAVPGERVVKIIENLRKVPIDAWSVVYRDGTSQSTVRIDTCSGHPLVPGRNAIAPGEARRSVGASAEEIGAPVNAQLSMVLFRDGYFEGLRSEVDDVIRSRKARGLTCGG